MRRTVNVQNTAEFRFNPRIRKRCDYELLARITFYVSFNPRIRKRCDGARQL